MTRRAPKARPVAKQHLASVLTKARAVTMRFMIDAIVININQTAGKEEGEEGVVSLRVATQQERKFQT